MRWKIQALRKMGRRRFLKTLSELGVSAATLRHLRQENIESHTINIKDEIPYTKAQKRDEKGNSTAVFGTIDRDRWVEIEATITATKQLRQNLENELDLSNITISARPPESKPNSDRWSILVKYQTYDRVYLTDDGYRKRKTVVPNVDLSVVEEALPSKTTGVVKAAEFTETVENISVSLETVRKQDQWYQYTYRPVPGGAEITDGTSGCRAELNSSGESVLLSAGHVINDPADFHQPRDGGVIGQPGEYYQEHPSDGDDDATDFGYIEPSSSVDLTDKLASPFSDGYKQSSILGATSWDWIKYDGPNATIHRQGAGSRTKSGSIIDTENALGQKVFWNSADSSLGDSGGPHYTDINDNRYIVGIHAWGQTMDGNDSSGGNSGKKIEDKLGVVIY